MKFKHPSDAMRARIEGKLTCMWCSCFDDSTDRWCKKERYAPIVNEPRPNKQYCEKFIMGKEEYPNGHWIVGPPFSKSST